MTGCAASLSCDTLLKALFLALKGSGWQIKGQTFQGVNWFNVAADSLTKPNKYAVKCKERKLWTRETITLKPG